MFDWLSPGKRAIKDVRHALSTLEERLDQLESEHRKLRGRFYQARGELAEPHARSESKAAVLARIGYVPGKPAPHNQG
jgi:predicted nuclease with TOPRIM domain